MSSNFNFYFGIAVKEIFEFAHSRLKISMFGHLIRTLTPLSTLIDKVLQKLKLDPVRVFDICTEMRSDSKRYFAFVMHEFF